LKISQLGTTRTFIQGSIWTRISVWLLGAALMIFGPALCAQEVIVFPSLSIASSIGGSASKTTDKVAGASLFISHDVGSLRFLGEFLFSNTEKEIERAQIGWKFSHESTLWFGRFHTPLGFWNTEYHHGAFLQATIARPQIANFEDERGLLPLHGMGTLLQGKKAFGEGSLNFETSLASGPSLTNEGLEPVPVLKTQHYGKTGGALKLSWQPNVTSNTQFGVSLAKFTFPYEGAPADSLTQTVANGFVNWELQKWRVLGEVYVTRHSGVEGGVRNRATLTSAYLQSEYRISDVLLGYFRVENLSAPVSDPLISRNLTLAKRSGLIGGRFDFHKRLALKVEASSRHLFDNTTSQVIAVQISGAFQ
jgi:hypothetical protein